MTTAPSLNLSKYRFILKIFTRSAVILIKYLKTQTSKIFSMNFALIVETLKTYSMKLIKPK